MKKVLLFLVAMLVMTSQVFAERVTQDDAALVATNFMNPQVSQKSSAKKAPAKRMVLKKAAVRQENEYFVFENADGEGWVIIAANDVARPIVGYSFTGRFSTENQPANIRAWFNGYDRIIRAAEADGLEQSEEVKAEWEALRSSVRTATAATVVVAPLISTTWDQDSPYWNKCPDGNVYTGCVATAMAQVMNYYQWPVQGEGSHSITYNSKTYSVDFSETTYDWNNMVDHYTKYYQDGSSSTTSVSTPTTAQKNAVATLMYHCGVACDMEYTTDGSGAYTIDYNGYWSGQGTMCAETALTTFFKYKKSTIHGYYRNGDSSSGLSSWTDANWIAMLKEELDNARPIMYAGGDSKGESGHSFVCDGYNSDSYFHFNWGWSGYGNGYYSVNALQPGPGGAGSGDSGDYSYYQDVIVGIVPDKPADPVSSITLSVSSLTLKQNERATLKATVLPTSAEQSVTWSSSDEGVATVLNGVVRGKAKGTAKITAAANDDSGVKAECSVTVTDEVLTDYSDTHESNVTLTTEGQIEGSAAKVVIDNVQYDALKFGTSKAEGAWNQTIPAGTTKLCFHAAAWKGTTSVTLNIISPSSSSVRGVNKRKAVQAVTVSPTSFDVSASTGITGNSPFTITDEDVAGEGYYFEIELSGVESNTTLAFEPAETKRFVVWGVNAITATSDVASISVDPAELVFDVSLDKDGGYEGTQTITVTGNNLSADLDIIEATLTGDANFEITSPAAAQSGKYELPAAGGDIVVKLSATEAGTFTGTISLLSYDDELAEVSKTITLTANVAAYTEPSTGGTDVINLEFTGVTGTSYKTWEDKAGTSGAVYAGGNAGGNSSVQLNASTATSTRGIVSTTSAGLVKSVQVTFNSNTSANRTVRVYGSNEALTLSSIANGSTPGTLVGTLTYDADNLTQSVAFNEDYEYVAITAPSAVYLDEIQIVWGSTSSSTEASITANPASLTFNETLTASGVDVNKTVTVTGANLNSASSNFIYAYIDNDDANDDAEFSVSPDQLAVSGGELTVNVIAVSAGTYTADLVIYSMDADWQQVTTTVPITATIAAEPQTFTITWSVDGTTTTADFAEGAALVLPADPTCESGRVFVGWTEQSSFSEAPADLFTEAGNKTVTGEATYYAAFATATQSQGGGVEEKEASATTFTDIAGELDENISFEAAKGNAATVPAVNNGVIRIYQNGGTLTITAKNDATITSITIGSAMATSVTYALNGGEASESQAIAANGTFDLANISATTVLFTCMGTDKNSRLYLNNLKVNYSIAGGASVTYSDYSQSCSSNESSDKQMTLTLVYKSGEWSDDINIRAWYYDADKDSNIQLLGAGAAMTLGQDGFHTITVNVPSAVNAINAQLNDGTYTSEVIENIAVSANGNANIKVGDRDNYMGEEFYAYQVYFNRFFDEDGTTLLWTAISDIEDVPVYEGVTPYKDANHIFNGWTPALAKADGEHTATFVQAQIADELLPGKFTVDANGQRVKFARGNIVHSVSDGSWEIARTQDFVVGHNNIHIGDPDYTGLIDHFAWSTDDRNDYGVYPSNADADYEGNYVEWGALFGSEWVTMTKDQWYYLIHTRQNAGQLWGNGQVADRKGVIFLPDDWQLPDGMSFVAQYKTENYFSHDVFEHNVYTAEEWQVMENAGAIFLPAAGSRTGGYGNTMNGTTQATFFNPETGYYSWVDNVDDYGYYWTSQLDGSSKPYFLIFGGERNDMAYQNPVFWGGRERRRGHTVRLAQLVPEYTITVADGIENGTVAANVSKAEEGEIITLTITPADGYKLKELTVLDENSEPVVVSANNTFAMPASNVTVSAVFEEKPQVTGYVRVESAPNDWSGKYLIVYEDGSLALNGGLTDKLDAVGNSITVSISEGVIAASEEVDAASFTIAAIDGGYSILGAGGLYMGQTSDANGMQSNNETVYLNTISLSESGDALISSGGAYLRYNSASNQTRFRYYKSATYTSQQPVHLYKSSDEVTPVEKYAINIKQIDNATISVVGNLTEAAEGQTVTLSIATASGWDLDYFTTNGDPVVGNSFTMPAEAVEVSAVLKQHVAELFYITLDYDNTKGIVQLPNEAPNGLEAGTEVTIDLTYQPGYTLGSLTVINELTGESVEIQDAVAATQKIFIMPASNVTITIEFVARVYYTVTVADGIENGTVVADPTSAEEGDEVTLTITPADGYQLKSLTVVDANNEPVAVSNNSFTMPASNVTISAEFEEATGGTATFIFNTDDGLAALGIEKPETGNGTALGDAVYTSNGINLSATGGTTGTRVYNSSGNTDLRIYKTATLTISGPSITRIEFNGATTAVFTVEVGSYNSGVWEGEADEVVFTATGTGKINTITVTYSGSVTPAAKYYLAADESLVGGDNAWQPNVVEMVNGTITISDVAAGEHKFKVTDGQWNSETETDHEFTTTDADCTTADVSYDSYGNICFTTYKVQDVVISIVNGKVCVKADTEKLYYLAASASLVGDANAWQPNVVEMVNGTITLNNIAAGTHAFKVTDGAWNGGAETDHEFNVWNDECSNVTLTYDDNGNISFSTNEEQNITISIVNKEICVEVADIPVTLNAHYAKVSEALSDWAGDYLIVYEEGALALNGALDDQLDASQNGLSVEIKETEKGIKYIQATDATVAAEFSIAASNEGYTIQNKSALYIGMTTDANGLKAQAAELDNSIAYNSTDECVDIIASGGAHLRYNATIGQERFRYFKSSTYSAQKPVQLYKKASGEVPTEVENNAQTEVMISITGNTLVNMTGHEVGIFSVTGQRMATVVEHFDISTLPAGMYVVSDGKNTFKLLTR